MRRLSFAATVAAALIQLPAAAAERAVPLIVTAARMPQSADAALAAVEVIDRDAILRSGARSLPELLTGRTGVDLSVSGGPGKLTGLFLRGTESDHTLVLVDGVRIASASAGFAAIEFISLDEIERIEIVRGPRATLYGSDAIGGVVQIFTRRGRHTPRFEADATFTDQQSRRLAGGASGRIGPWSYALTLSDRRSDGIDATRTGHPDADGFSDRAVALALGYSGARGDTLELSLLRNRGNTEFDDCFNSAFANSGDCRTDFVLQSGQLGAELEVNPFWAMRLQLGASEDDQEQFWEGAANGRFISRRRQASWQHTLRADARQTLVAGIDYLDDRVAGTTAYARCARDNTGLFAQWLGGIGALDLEAGLRSDRNQQFGRHTTWSLGAGIALGAMRVTGAYATAFRAPSFNDLYFPGFSNPDLKPESSESFELGLRRRLAGGEAFVNLFRTKIRDLILFDTALSKPINIGRARIDGLEAGWQGALGAWRGDLALTLLDPRDLDGGRRLPRRAVHSLRLGAGRAFGPLTLDLHALWQGPRSDSDFSSFPVASVELDDYLLLGVRLGYALDRQWRLALEVENLLNADYQTAHGFNMPGRTLGLSLAFRSD